jgi:hypothetical protein
MPSRGQMHNQMSLRFLYAAYKSGDTVLADKVDKILRKDMEQQAAYYESLSENKRYAMSQEEQRNDNLLKGLLSLEQQFKTAPKLNPESTGTITTPNMPADTPR